MGEDLYSSENRNNNSGFSHSIWMEIEIPSPPPLDKNLKSDICIVGSGIAGLTCAYLLAKEKKSVVLLERGALAGGQSARTTGHLTYILDDRFSDLKTLFGEEGVKLAYESHNQAVDTIEKIVNKENIDCDFERLDGYLFLPPDGSYQELEEEYNILKNIGAQVIKVEKAPFESFNTGPCLRFPNQAQFHILKYIKALIPILQKMGVKIFCNTKAIEFIENDSCHVKTDLGYTVDCQSLIIAANTPVNDRFYIHSKQAPYRTYVIAGLVPKGYVQKALYWDTPDPYHYIRIQKNEADPNTEWLLIGGEDHKTGQFAEIEEKYDILEKWAHERFPKLLPIQFRWSGQIIEPCDSLAYIGRNPHSNNTYIVTGDSGNGLTHGTIAGLLISDLIMGRENPWIDLYQPSRKTFAAASEFTKENLNVAGQYSEWILPGDLNKFEEIPFGSGAVIRNGLHKEAIYKDEEGKIFCCSAVCPHLGCIVDWNSGEKSWDCPCHGSRFDPYGRVLNGPATKNLSPCKRPIV